MPSWRSDVVMGARYRVLDHVYENVPPEWHTLEGTEVVADACRVGRVGDQSNVAVGAHEDQGVGAVGVGHVPVGVGEATRPDAVGLDEVGLELRGATEGEEGETRATEEVEEAGRVAG